MELGGLEGTFAQVLAEQRRRLPNARVFGYSLKRRRTSLRDVRLQRFQVERKLESQADLEKAFAPNVPEGAAQLVELRREVLEKLQANCRALVRELPRLNAKERDYRDKIVEVSNFLKERTFFKRSSAPLDARSFTDIPVALQWLLGAERRRELVRASVGVFRGAPVLSTTVALVVTLLVMARRRLIASLAESGRQLHRISNDGYRHTAKAVGATVLLALPVPLVLGYAGWALGRDTQGSDWLRGFSLGLYWSALIVAGAWFLAATCRPHGLGVAHFRWNEEAMTRVRRALFQCMVVYLPGFVIIASFFYENSSQHFDSVGRHALNIAHLVMALVLAKFLRPSDGIVADVIKEHPRRMVATLRYVWFPLVILFPIALVVLACLGYVMTALVLSLVDMATLGIVAAGVLFYHLVLRWLMIKERRLALAKAIEERRARREAAQHEEDPVGKEVVDVDEPEIDLDAMGQQTRRLLRSLTIVGVIIAVWFLWAQTLPVNQALQRLSIGNFSLLEIVQAVLVGVTFTVVVRNLPGLLELTGLRAAAKDAGTRYAVATICQYGLTAVGLAMLFNVLDLDWSKFGWIATGLSVGLGFGMQEIVANFVCGIILLFERPIRVGDIVTLDSVTGKVTRIRMRATTITNWDRQEYVVPNKQLVTGTFINWTLTSPINRIVISVGVAYGSDTDKVLQILRDVAHDHPRIMDEPAPLVTFEQFADSTLNFTLRCYLPDMDGRTGTISELNKTIDDRFKEAGLEIAFPQQDLHIRTIGSSVAEKLKGLGADQRSP